MIRAEVKDVKDNLESLLKAAENEVVALTENGKVRFLIEAADEDDLADLQIEQNPRFQESVQRAREQWQQGDFMTHEEVVKKYLTRPES